MDPNFDSAGAQKSIDEQFASDAQARDAQTNADMAAAEQERQSRRQGAKSGYDSLMDASNQIVTEELQNLSDQSAENLKAVGDELKQAKDAFNTSVAEASKPDKKQPEQKKIPSRKFDWQDSGADKASSVGTFSAFGLSQMGVGSVMQKIADFTQRTAEATEELVDKMDGGELEFGS